MRPRLGAVLAAAALAAGCAHSRLKLEAGETGEVIEAEGWTPVDAADAVGTRQRALADAQKKAVERVVGVFISAKTRVDQAVNVDSRILANVKGYIRKYDVLGDREEDGMHKTRIRALVLYRKLGDDLKELGLTRPPPPPGNPRVAVRVRAKGGEAALGEAAAQGARRALVEKGFTVVGDGEPKADLVVAGEAEAYPIEDARLAGFKSYRARVTLQAAKASGEVVSQKSQEASGLDPTAEVAQGKAYDAAGGLAGAAIANELASLLKSRAAVTVRLVGRPSAASKPGLEGARAFIDDLRNNPGVEQVTLSSYAPGRVELSVLTEDVTGEELAAIILRMKKYELTARSVSAYEVEVEGR